MNIEEKAGKDIFKRIVEENWESFKKVNSQYNNEQYNAVVEKMLVCGTEMGGYTEIICTECGKDLRRVPFSCKSMFCLSCSKVYVDNMVSQVSKMLHPGMRYRHVVLTVPKQLRKYFYKGRFDGKLLSQLMGTAYKCLENTLKDVFKKKVKIGLIVVLQTHGRSGQYNPHVHVIMTSGGIDEEKKEWKELKYLPFEMLHKKWQYYLFEMMKEVEPTEEMRELINKMYKEYPKGLVAFISKGEAPKEAKGLAIYLAKYVAAPPISVRRIVEYDGKTVTYWYNDHETKAVKTETVDVMTFLGRMVQHILPKGFQRVRYYGLQATKTFQKWQDTIIRGLKSLTGAVKDVFEVVAKKTYRERYQEGCGKDPFRCRCCGGKMEVWQIWHPKYGVIFSEGERIKNGYYERGRESDGERGYAVWPTSKNVQLSLFKV
jgi:hypothetical protein